MHIEHAAETLTRPTFQPAVVDPAAAVMGTAPLPPPDPRRDALDDLGDQIAELSSRIQAATYELLVLIREFDARSGWSGCTSCAHWLSWRTGLAPGAAREHVRVARALANLPKLSDAMRRGSVSYSKVRAVTRVATPDNEQTLLDVALAGTAAHVEQIVRGWRRVDRAEEQAEDQRRQERRSLRTWVDADGMVIVQGRLTPEVGAALRRALEAACDQLQQPRARAAADATAGGDAREAATQEIDSVAEELAPSFSQRQADAIGLLAESALSGGLDKGAAGDRYQVVLHVDGAALAESADVPAGTSSATEGSLAARGQTLLDEDGGMHVSQETARRLACDSATVEMRHGAAGEILDVGRRRRTVSPALRRALAARDRQCRFPGCQNRKCDAHHVEHWADGGATALDNLVLLCRRHHRAVHEEGFGVTLDAGGDVRFTRPDGRLLPVAPPAPGWTGRPLAPVNARLEQEQIDIDGRTSLPLWRGERLNREWAVSLLWQPRADTAETATS